MPERRWWRRICGTCRQYLLIRKHGIMPDGVACYEGVAYVCEFDLFVREYDGNACPHHAYPLKKKGKK